MLCHTHLPEQRSQWIIDRSYDPKDFPPLCQLMVSDIRHAGNVTNMDLKGLGLSIEVSSLRALIRTDSNASRRLDQR